MATYSKSLFERIWPELTPGNEKELERKNNHQKYKNIYEFFGVDEEPRVNKVKFIAFSQSFIDENKGKTVYELRKLSGVGHAIAEHIPEDAILNADGSLEWWE